MAEEMEKTCAPVEIAPVFSADPARRRILGWLFIALPLFGQTFSYMNGLLPLWALSKAFPVLSLPLALYLMNQARFPMTRQVLISFVWLLLLPSFSAVFYFHEGFFTSITAQVKLLPLLYFFSFLALLLQLRPTLHELERGFVYLAVFIVVTLIVLWAVIPTSWYQTSYVVGNSPLFTADNRGHRIRMSMYFPLIALFFCYRRAYFERSLRYLAYVLVVFAVTLLIVKTRAMIIGIVGVMAINAVRWSRPAVKVGLLVLAPVVIIGIFSFGYLATTFSTSASSGFDVRLVTLKTALQFLGSNPLRWIFGVGTISPTSRDSLIAYFHHFFFLADITWLGVVFEYGLIGALMFLLIEVRGLTFYRRLHAEVEDDFLGALADYLIYVLVISFFYPPTLTPGESAVILAIFVYVWRVGGFDGKIHDTRNTQHAQPQTP
ncbi:MAG: hypothetical protein ACTHJ1_18050 [Bordetella sp.]|uniref:hypothetical protein n=1 Tax=Bordetella sp. TaxID=28081 RepID=UPI003F7C447A